MIDPGSSVLFWVAVCVAGVVGGLALLWRGLAGYRAAARVGDTASSRIASLAVGEVRVSGSVEAAEVTLVSPLQSAPCVWFRSRVATTGDDARTVFREERGVGFRVRDASGAIRVFPSGAGFDVPPRFHERTGMLGESPPGLLPRTGPVVEVAGALGRDAAAQALLTVHGADVDPASQGASLVGLFGGSSGREYEEARIEPGDVVTVVGTALPFADLPDPLSADRMDGTGLDADDAVVAAEVEEARETGALLSPDQAWGNAAIPGFGIGRPVSRPTLDPRATQPQLASPEEAARVQATFDLRPDSVVLASAGGSFLLVALGGPGEVEARQQGRFLVGLLGAVLAIASAVAAAFLLANGTL